MIDNKLGILSENGKHWLLASDWRSVLGGKRIGSYITLEHRRNKREVTGTIIEWVDDKGNKVKNRKDAMGARLQLWSSILELQTNIAYISQTLIWYRD